MADDCRCHAASPFHLIDGGQEIARCGQFVHKTVCLSLPTRSSRLFATGSCLWTAASASSRPASLAAEAMRPACYGPPHTPPQGGSYPDIAQALGHDAAAAEGAAVAAQIRFSLAKPLRWVELLGRIANEGPVEWIELPGTAVNTPFSAGSAPAAACRRAMPRGGRYARARTSIGATVDLGSRRTSSWILGPASALPEDSRPTVK